MDTLISFDWIKIVQNYQQEVASYVARLLE